jgi:hypothetical protein
LRFLRGWTWRMTSSRLLRRVALVRWRSERPPKRRFLQKPHSVTSQKTPFFVSWSRLHVVTVQRLPLSECQSEGYRQVCPGIRHNLCSATILSLPWKIFSVICGSQLVGCPLWRGHVSVIYQYNFCWSFQHRHARVEVPQGLVTILSRIPRLCGSVTNNSTWIRIGYRIYSLWRL